VLEKKVWGIFGPEGKIWQKNGKKLLNEELHNLYFFSNIGMIKTRMISWVGHLTYRREERSSYKVLLENLKSTNHF
jgi:hypothetical protein